MPAHRRPVDNYTLRRRAELAQRRLPPRPARQPIPRETILEQRTQLRQAMAAELLLKMRNRRELPPSRYDKPNRWTLLQDRTLLRAIREGVPLEQLRERVAPVRPQVTSGSCVSRWGKLCRNAGLR